MSPPSSEAAHHRRRVDLARYVPPLRWARGYRASTLGHDAVAAVIVTAMLVPQALAYALLAELPPSAGLYASIVPLAAYALFGTSPALAVGPVAVVSLMTAAALGEVAAPGTEAHAAAALVLAALSGGFLALLGLFRLGFLGHFLSHAVITGFITATALLIAASQLGPLFGVETAGRTLYDRLSTLAGALPEVNPATAAVGISTLALLLAGRLGLAPLLRALGAREERAALFARLAPLFAVALATAATALLDLPARGVDIVGDVPRGLPPLTAPPFELDLWIELSAAAVLISIVGFAESLSVAQTLAARRRERVEPDQELVGLGAANLGASLTGGYPVTGGFSRSVVASDAGAKTPAAGALTALGVAAVALLFTPLIHDLPRAALAAVIIAAVASLFDFGSIRRIFRFSKPDFSAIVVTFAVTVGVGVEAGLLAGVATSIALFLYRTSRPHIAVVGLVPGTEHVRNARRYEVATSPRILAIRIDGGLYFANARYLEDQIDALVADGPDLEHVVLVLAAVNEIDASALESLEALSRRLGDRGLSLHLAEVRGPVADALARTDFPARLNGHVFLSPFRAFESLDPDLAASAGPRAEGDRSSRVS